jgi:hypothetical protein
MMGSSGRWRARRLDAMGAACGSASRNRGNEKISVGQGHTRADHAQSAPAGCPAMDQTDAGAGAVKATRDVSVVASGIGPFGRTTRAGANL